VLAFTRLRDGGYLKSLGINPKPSKVALQIQKALKAGVITKRDAATLMQAVRSAPSTKMFQPNWWQALWQLGVWIGGPAAR